MSLLTNVPPRTLHADGTEDDLITPQPPTSANLIVVQQALPPQQSLQPLPQSSSDPNDPAQKQRCAAAQQHAVLVKTLVRLLFVRTADDPAKQANLKAMMEAMKAERQAGTLTNIPKELMRRARPIAGETVLRNALNEVKLLQHPPLQQSHQPPPQASFDPNDPAQQRKRTEAQQHAVRVKELVLLLFVRTADDPAKQANLKAMLKTMKAGRQAGTLANIPRELVRRARPIVGEAVLRDALNEVKSRFKQNRSENSSNADSSTTGSGGNGGNGI